MLHKINVPSCQIYLEWIINLQRCLLQTLCQDNVKPQDIKPEWVIKVLATFKIKDNWIKNLCERRDQISGIKREFLEHMKVIADLPNNKKKELLEVFESDHNFYSIFNTNFNRTYVPNIFEAESNFYIFSLPTQLLKGISCIQETSTKEAIRGFFEIFYAPNFYSSVGYHIAENNTVLHFYRGKFIESFITDNKNLSVCPMCDGSVDSREIDHFYPKSDFPFLSCHPLNLVPVCSTCNKPENKANHPPLTLKNSEGQNSKTAEEQTLDWFHPYLRPLTQSKDDFSTKITINLETTDKGTKPVLSSIDPQTQKRIDNLNSLVKLDTRWQAKLSIEIRSTQNLLRERKKYLTNNRRINNPQELCNYLKEDLAENAKCDIGTKPNAILEYHYLLSASNVSTAIFEELWIYFTDSDPLP